MATISRFRIFIYVAAAFSTILILSGFYTQGVTPNDVANKIASHVSSANAPTKHAYMTLLTNTMGEGDDPLHEHYFMATRLLGYQLLHQPSTKTQKNIPFVVLVTKDVSKAKRDLLSGDGCTVLEVDYVDVDLTWVVGEMPEWADVMTKLRAWELVQYDKIAFLDGDFILNRCIDGIFDDPATNLTNPLPNIASPTDEGDLPTDYMLASVPEANPIHAYPPTAENGDYKDPNYFNAGFFLFTPSKALFNHFNKILSIKNRFDPKYPEQNLLNYAFRRDGKMPWVNMESSWHIRFPTVGDKEKGVASMHDKWWHAHMDDKLQPFYDSVRWKMEGFYEVRNPQVSSAAGP